jgi:Fe-S-cluster-containing dehydrogenase component
MLNEDDDVSRRSFLKLLGASLALAGLDGCTRIPAEKILPYVNQPPELTPGIPLHYATSMVLDGFATGLVVEAHEGRPTKVEGNPEHPASLGAAGVLEQASVLQLYDPHRATHVRFGRSASSWEAFTATFSPTQLGARVGRAGEGLALLLEPTSSPLIADLVARLQTLYPRMSVHYYAPFARNDARLPLYDLDNGDVILAVDSDFLSAGPFNLRYARQFANRRRDPRAGMNRLYAIEGTFTVTGAAADHRLRARPSEVEPLLQQLHATIGMTGATSAASTQSISWIQGVGADLHAHAGRSLVIAGDRLSPRARALVESINAALGNVGRTVTSRPSPLLGAGDTTATLAALVERIRSGGIDTLICIGGNPCYASPASLGFTDLLRKVPNSAYVGMYENETAAGAKWFVPAAHYLETWGDARAYDGTLSVIQPLVQPLRGGKSPVEVLSALTGSPAANPLEQLRARWRGLGVAPKDDDWADALRRGFVPATIPQPVASASPVGIATAQIEAPSGGEIPSGGIEIVFAPDPRVHDGSFANNAWLQELPDPVTKLTWDNAAMISPATAARLKVESGDSIVLESGKASLQLPVLIVAGHADDLATLPFGYGRTGAEEVARGVGVDVYRLWLSVDAFVAAATARRADAPHHDFAITQTHWRMEGRGQAKSETVAEYRTRAATTTPARRRELTIYDPVERLTAPQQWAMTIDLGTCIGCGACTVACQAENNIPVVGKDDVMKSREMHWIRIDRYLEGVDENPEVITQPMLCQHCENAPCEYVCPVGATTHSDDGINEMVYNRCVGTRFCSNNCPYKVRRFNWFDYNAHLTELERMVKNPDVTVRERGVMEKCTFCVQRIREAEIAAATMGRPFSGNDVKTACQQACPTNAIVFGSLTDPNAEVVRRRDDSRVYGVLEELGTEPRVRYLARIRNPNPALESTR